MVRHPAVRGIACSDWNRILLFDDVDNKLEWSVDQGIALSDQFTKMENEMTDLAAESLDIRQNDTAEKFLLEEFKLIASGIQQAFQILASWFSFFFTFELVALGWITDAAHKLGKMNSIVVPLSFIGLHILAILALVLFNLSLRDSQRRVEKIRSAVGISVGDPIQYALYGGVSYLMGCSLLISFSVWTLQIPY